VFLAHVNWGSRDIAHISSLTCTEEAPKMVLHVLCVICLNGQNWVEATILPASAGTLREAIFFDLLGFLLRSQNHRGGRQAVLGGVSMCPREGIEPLGRSLVAVKTIFSRCTSPYNLAF
jgi:hypothetical protein